MGQGRHEYRERKLARRFRHQVAVLVPPMGLGATLTAMNTWCRDQYGIDGWASFHRSEHVPEPKDWSIFAFATAEDAAAFQECWADQVELEAERQG